jgi:hypothetical protein
VRRRADDAYADCTYADSHRAHRYTATNFDRDGDNNRDIHTNRDANTHTDSIPNADHHRYSASN